ncbi:C6 transcription factor (Acr-2) [Talaromyces proteolyticus]|uniref:C6 transcription factor (Acr-2) n=1 Tax=Talaromyces proteolyticus TaxID=1131652 RepID=A0AAD4KXW4_9EURO|nr:C6 transcription factor (Acr-2) [Talaromyces proteolyticus]KAH8701552.1 C6 transcription factor (Acr-2) [Talaromyces proteolyticus]
MLDPCYTCRRRRIQCDRTGDPCAKCEKSGFECFQKRPLRWVKGVTLRSKFHSPVLKATTSSRDRSSTTDTQYTPSAVTDRLLAMQDTMESGLPRKAVTESHGLSLYYPEGPCNNHNKTHHSTPVNESALVSSQRLQNQSIAHLDKKSMYYLDYYNDRICKLFIVQDSDSNPLRNLIPLALEDSVLMNAVLTLAARHHANIGRAFNRSNSDSPSTLYTKANRDALCYKYKAIQGLTSSVKDSRLSQQDATVASIFLLIFLDLLESGSDQWNVHLEGAKSLITHNKRYFELSDGTRASPGQTVCDIRNFIASQIYLIGTLGGTFVRPKLLTHFNQFYEPAPPPLDVVERSFLGCPAYLLNAIQNLSAQRDAIADNRGFHDSTIHDQVTAIKSIMESIQKFDSYDWAASLPHRHQSPHQHISSLCALASSYKLGALIYSRRILDACTDSNSSQVDLVCELIGVIDSLRNTDSLFKCILWPIFVAGLECPWQAHRQFLVDCLERFWRLTLCLNVVNASEILSAYWQECDQKCQSSIQSNSSQWIFNMGRLGQDWLLI